jgi:hypothetical protein
MSLAHPDHQVSPAVRSGRWKRRLKWAAISAVLAIVATAFIVKDYVRTLQSLRRVPGTNAFVMDYYVDYHIDEIRQHGMDVRNIEDSLVSTLFPDFVLPIVARVKRAYLPVETRTIESGGQHCSTVAIRSKDGNVFFGRNFDWHHDACLILRVHDGLGVASISVLDLAYLNLDRHDLDQTSLLQRIPLLFAPYYLMDGMNRYGVAVADMSADAQPPRDSAKPAIIQPTLMRLILDRAKDADEGVNLVREFNVHFVDVPEHLMVADASGRFRVIEYVDGEVVVTSSERPWQVCTNHILSGKSERQNDDACARYRAGSNLAASLRGDIDQAAALRITRGMSVDGLTMWSSVYDLTSRRVCLLYKALRSNEYRDAIDFANDDERPSPREPAAGPISNGRSSAPGP